MQPDILTDLLAGRHFDMEERDRLGLLPHEVLRYTDARDHLASVISERDWFPREYVAHVPGQVVDERLVIQRLGPHRFVCHAARAQAIAPTVLAEESHRRFISAQHAADYYLHWEHHLPGDLDGWKVV